MLRNDRDSLGPNRQPPRPRDRQARALAGRPQLLIADEPTGQLDSQTGQQIRLEDGSLTDF